MPEQIMLMFARDTVGILVCRTCNRMLEITTDLVANDTDRVGAKVCEWAAVHQDCALAELKLL